MAASSVSTPSTMTETSPMEPPMKPRCPGKAGVAPLRTTQTWRPSCSSSQAKLWWLWTSSRAGDPRISQTRSQTQSRPA